MSRQYCTTYPRPPRPKRTTAQQQPHTQKREVNKMNFEEMKQTLNGLEYVNERIEKVEDFIKNNFDGYKEAKTHISMSDIDGSHDLGFFIEYSKIKPFIIEYLEELKARSNELKSELGIEDDK